MNSDTSLVHYFKIWSNMDLTSSAVSTRVYSIRFWSPVSLKCLQLKACPKLTDFVPLTKIISFAPRQNMTVFVSMIWRYCYWSATLFDVAESSWTYLVIIFEDLNWFLWRLCELLFQPKLSLEVQD